MPLEKHLFLVCEDYTDEVDVAVLVGGEAAGALVRAEQEKRQRAWVERSTDSAPSAWRAAKRPRTASHIFIRYLDNQVLRATGEGLAQFQKPEASTERSPDPRAWPRLRLALDQHPTQLCATVFLARSCHLNVEIGWDLPHGNWQDVIGALKDIAYWSHMLLCMVADNTPCGPWADDARWQQCRSALDRLFTHHSYNTCRSSWTCCPC